MLIRRPLVAAGVGGVLVTGLVIGLLADGRGSPGGEDPSARLASAAATPVPSTGSPSDLANLVRPKAMAQWADFPADAAPRPIVLVGPDQEHTSWRTDLEQASYFAFRWNVPDRLPASPPRVSGYPLISAAQALAGLRGGKAVSHKPGFRLTVTDIRLGTRTYLTDRGKRRLPTWIVTFRGGTYGPSSILAITSSQRRDPKVLPGPNMITKVRVAPDGRTLTVRFIGARAGNGPCEAEYDGGVQESAGAVGIVLRERPGAPPPPRPDGRTWGCADVGHLRTVTIHLAKQLGGRVVIDAVTAAPIPVVGPGVQP